MSISFPANLSFVGSFSRCELFIPEASSRKNSQIAAARITTSPSIQKSNRVGGSELSVLSSNFESSKKARVQELVDRLHQCARSGSHSETKTIHGYVLKSDFDDDSLLILLNHVIYAYWKCSDFNSAKALFDYLPKKNVFSWSVMISGFNQKALFRNGFDYFCEMMVQGILPDGFTYSSILQSCVGIGSIDLGYMLHTQIVVRGFTSHGVVSTTLLNMYSKMGKIEEAYKVFRSMDEHDDVSWNAIISGLGANGRESDAFDHFLKMKREGYIPDKFTFVSVLKAVGMLGDVEKGKIAHECVLEFDLQDNILVGTALIDMYAKCGDIDAARSVFDMNFSNCSINGPWNAMISAYSTCKYSLQALQLYDEMCRRNIESDIYTYCSVFDAIANLKYLSLAKEVHGMVLKSGHDLVDLSDAMNAIADAYSKCGSLEDVEKIFNTMKCRDIVSWTTLVSCYSRCSKWDDALLTFSRMREDGFVPNDFTLCSVLTACANLCYLEYGREIHGVVCKLGLETVKYVESALIDMYAKGGSITDAENVFDRISDPDVVSLTAIISGYAYHGFVAHALWHFKRMESMGINPNAVTLLCVLFACSHAGLVEEGLEYFYAMEKRYNVVPEMEHYACVIDLLGRVGRLDEAFDFITKMPVEPDEMAWQALLAGCRVHGNVAMGEIAAEKIHSLCPEYSSTYVLLSNTYMETGSVNDGVNVRKTMKQRGVRKEPGCSWISVDGKIHKFFAGDMNHPRKEEIFVKLEELGRKMKSMGYVPDLRYVLQVED